MATPAASCRLSSTRRLITGSRMLSSRQMSSTKDVTAVSPSIVTKRDSNQSNRSPRSSIHWSDPTHNASSKIPVPSMVDARSWCSESCTYAHTRKAARIPSGMLM